MSKAATPLTNTFLFRKNSSNELQVLLGKKKRGWMVGIWNGFGGKLENEETVEQAAKRELQEESNVIGEDITRIGFFYQTFEDKPEKKLEIHVFYCEKWNGIISETEEMAPKWFNCNEIPEKEMWADDSIWLPYLFKKSYFTGSCHFETDKPEAMLSYEYREISSLELDKIVKEKGYHP